MATKRDLDALEARLDARFGQVEARFDTMEARFNARLEHELRLLTWRVLVAMVATMSVLVSVTVAAVRL
ncbi:MAG TPA: hypothetical protein VFA11_15470 [Acidimicrobiales bacterium]|nr:hypothetical protein [Acidimicrobiales bacterium]